MRIKYKFRDREHLYFVTFAVINWIDLFIRNEYKEIMLDSWKPPIWREYAALESGERTRDNNEFAINRPIWREYAAQATGLGTRDKTNLR